MQVTLEEAQLFFKLYFALLAYTNRQRKVVPKISKPEDIPGAGIANLGKIRDELFSHVNLLEQFVHENSEGFSPDELKIAEGWRHYIAGDFFILKYLKKYTIFIPAQSNPETYHLYGVLSLIDPLEDILGDHPLPLLVKTVLLPFQGKIIYDGMVAPYSMLFGPGFRGDLTDTYRRLKQREGIIEQLADAEGQRLLKTSAERSPAKKPAPDWRPAINEMAARVEGMRKADTPKQRNTLSLLRAATNFSQSIFEDPENLDEQLRRFSQVRRAMTQLERLIDAEKYGFFEDDF
jgi:hypothetical protein